MKTAPVALRLSVSELRGLGACENVAEERALLEYTFGGLLF